MPVGWAIVVVAQWLAIVTLAVVVLGVLRQAAPPLERPAGSPPRRMVSQGPEVGTKLPPFTGRGPEGEILHAAQLLTGPAVLLFLSATCAPCVALAGEIGVSDLGELDYALVVVIDPSDHGLLPLPARLRVLVMPGSEVAEVFAVRGRPFAVVADADGVVRAKRGLNTVAQLRNLAGPVMRTAVAATASDNDAESTV
jgi:hypothetical protein